MKVSIMKYSIGLSEIPVITLNLHDGSEPQHFYPEDGNVSVELVDTICDLLQKGVQIEYIDNPTIADTRF
jgi:hypothetical protein